jgi:flagellar hook assembly protein FlgD
LVAVLACGALAACDAIFGKELNPKFCAAHPADQQCLGDAATSCSSSAECPTPLVCDEGGTNTCVACTPQEAAACTGATPVCSDAHMCRGCAAHAECAGSDACLPDGSCGDPGQVAYVKPLALGGTDNPSCTLAMPCTKVASALQTGRPYVKLAGTNDEGGTLSVDNRNVTLLAERDAKLIRTSNGLHVEVKGTSQVEIYDLEISGASGAQGVGISMPTGNTAKLTLRRVKILNNAGGGISASGGSLTVSQSTLLGNTGGGISASGGSLTVAQSTLANNAGGGISATNGTFAIVGNVFFNNGNDTLNVGGIAINTSQSPINRLEFNSFSRNKTQDGLGAAIQCVAGTFTARNNIMSENGTLTNLEQVGGTCAHAYSIVRPGTMPPGTGNSNADPLFVNTTTGDLHVGAGSPALGAADPNSDLAGIAERDLDGDVRMQPADIGADEVP